MQRNHWLLIAGCLGLTIVFVLGLGPSEVRGGDDDCRWVDVAKKKSDEKPRVPKAGETIAIYADYEAVCDVEKGEFQAGKRRKTISHWTGDIDPGFTVGEPAGPGPESTVSEQILCCKLPD